MPKSKLSKIFNDVSRLPAVQYERAMHMRGIARFYELPQSVTAAELEDFIRAFGPGETVSSLARELEMLNPELRKVPLNRADHVANFRFAMGVVSAFNVDDISYFMRSVSHNGRPALNSRKKGPTKEMIAFIEAAGRPDMEWAASRKTLEKICQRIKRKEAKIRRAALRPPQSPPA
jgi:hypothetical protein